MKIQSHSSLEILENRIAPAGVVTVIESSPGEFTLTGDGLDNQVSIFQTTPGAFRIEGLTGTTLNPGGVSFIDITKLTKLTFLGIDGNDALTLENVGTLTSLFMDGGVGTDSLTAINLKVKGNAELSGGDGFDFFNFDGLTTEITGNLKLTDSLGGIASNFSAEKTVIGGSIIVAGGTGNESMNAGGAGSLTIGKGIDFDAGTVGSGSIQFGLQDFMKIGKLATGESVLFRGTDGGTVGFSTGATTLAGGVRMTGGASTDQVFFSSASRNVQIGKLPTGESIKFDGLANADFLNVQGMNVSLAGGIDFNAGDGSNSINVSNANGKVSIGKLSTGQSIKFTGGVDGDTFTTDLSDLKLSGGIEFVGGEGSNVFTLSGVNGAATIGKLSAGASIKYSGGSGTDSATLSVASLTLAGAIDFAGGDGANSLTENAPNGLAKIGKLSTGASIKYTGGSGADSISTTSMSLNLAGGIDFAGGTAANSITLAGPNGKLLVGKLSTGQSLKYVGGTDGDQFTTNLASATFAGGFDFAGDDGTNAITFNGSGGVVTVGKLASGQSFLYFGGGGNDGLTSGQAVLNFAGGIDFAGGNGSNNVNFDANGIIRIGTNATGQSIKHTGGNDADSIFIGGPLIALKGSIEMTGDTGSNSIDFDGAATTIGKTASGVSIRLDGGTGSDLIDLEDTVTLAGSLTLEGGAGADTLDLTGISRLKVGGAVTFNGNADNDNFSINAFSLSLAQGLTYSGGDGTDDFSLVADGTILGDVIVNLGAATAADQATTLTSHNGLVPGLFLKGLLTITGTGIAASTDSLTITNVSVAKALTASLGAGVSTVTIDNLLAGDLFTLTTGDGADVVNFERNNFFGNSVITKLATIQTGNGNDLLLIGSPTPLPNTGLLDSTRVRFLGGLTLDGGADNDTRNGIDTENDFPAGAPTGLGTFEVIVV